MNARLQIALGRMRHLIASSASLCAAGSRRRMLALGSLRANSSQVSAPIAIICGFESARDVVGMSVQLQQEHPCLRSTRVVDHHGIVSSILDARARTGQSVDEGRRRVDGCRWPAEDDGVAEISEQMMLADVKQRLVNAYAELPPDRVSTAIDNARARFDTSPIRDFVPLLVERRARAELASAARWIVSRSSSASSL
jgi:hypothetical protein